jgi:hypothetical protein
MEKTYSLYIDNELIAENLTMNGNNYVSSEEVTGFPATFKLTVKDNEDNVTEEREHARLLQQVQYEWDGGKWYLAFADVSEQEIKEAKVRSDIDYIAMEAGIDLD